MAFYTRWLRLISIGPIVAGRRDSGNCRRRKSSVSPKCARLGLEILEGRNLPSATNVWTGAGGEDNWNVAQNWSLQRVPRNGDNLVFPSQAPSINSINDIPGLQLGNIEIDAPTTVSNYSIFGDPITLTGSITYKGGAPFPNNDYDLNTTLTAGTHTVNAVDADGVIELAGKFSGPGGIKNIGPGTMWLENNVNTFAGPLILQQGTVFFSDEASLSRGTIMATATATSPATLSSTGSPTIANALMLSGALNVHNNDSSPTTFTGNLKLAGTSSLTGVGVQFKGPLSGTGKLNLSGNNLVFAKNLSTAWAVTVAKFGSVEFKGVVSGGASFTVQQGGSLTLDSTNSYSGGTMVSGGTLTVNSKNAVGTGLLTLDGTSGPATLLTKNPITLNAPVGLKGAISVNSTSFMGAQLTLAKAVQVGTATTLSIPSGAGGVHAKLIFATGSSLTGPGTLTLQGSALGEAEFLGTTSVHVISTGPRVLLAGNLNGEVDLEKNTTGFIGARRKGLSLLAAAAFWSRIASWSRQETAPGTVAR